MRIIVDEIKTRWFLPVLFLIGIGLFIARKPEAAFVVQPGRIEDASILLEPAIHYSWSSLFIVAGNYLQLVPRAVALFSLNFGISNAPLVMNIVAIVIATLCAVFFSTKQFRFIIKNDWLRAACSIFIILVPGVDEIYSNISSIASFLNIFLMLFVLMLLFDYEGYKTKSKKEKYLYTFFCSVSFLTSAYSVIFLPVLLYVIIRELRRDRRDASTIASYAISSIILLSQTLILYLASSQQSRSSTLGVGRYVLDSSVNAFTISITRVFHYDTLGLSGSWGQLMYLVPVVVVVFVLLNSAKKGMRFEIFTLLCMAATLFWTAIIRRDLLDWECLCANSEPHYLFFAIVFAFVLIIRQFDRSRSKPFRAALVVVLIVVGSNLAFGFSIPFSYDDNWKYVSALYDHSGKYQCYIGEVPHGWSITVPCASPVSSNSTFLRNLNATGMVTTVTFTPPIQQTAVSITTSRSSIIYGLPVTFFATISPSPNGGAVQFYVDGVATGDPVTIFDGQATLSTSLLSVGQHSVSASYLGGPNFNASTSSTASFDVLSISELEGLNLQGAKLQGINLSDADLKQANLSGADLEQANLSGANLQRANLQSADLQGANLDGADLQNANLLGAILRGASTDGANFAGANMVSCNGCPQQK